MKRYNKVTEDQKQAVIELFYTEFDNSSSRIGEMTNVSTSNVNKILDKELKNKKNEKRHQSKSIDVSSRFWKDEM